ncbi:Valine--pyruvate aminotransferase [hydrothermal vent metagenome]|uniref:Valine--pyruvate aminotransferase n=1 Tax=hydrothermal vent metagenome TaxID=652676 RepID=A0A3B0WXF2_9ZZZZ
MHKKSQLADRIGDIQPFYVMDILSRAQQLEAQGHDVIHLEVGEPDFATPPRVKQAAIEAINQDKTQYTPATGLPELKNQLSRYYQQRLNTELADKNIVITPGASGALQLALSVLVNPGQNVLMSDPGYPCNRHFVRLLDGYAQTIAVGPESGYQLTSELIEAHWDSKTAAVLIASPSNPTGTRVAHREMQRIIDTVKRLGGVLLVDEIYQGLVYEQTDFSAAALSDHVFVINSFSKFFAMTGWRLGWLVVPDDYLEAVERLAQNLFLSPPTISQYAALSAFSADTLALLDSRRDELEKRRDFLIKGLLSSGFQISAHPQGAFYLYADISRFSTDSFTFCRQLLEDSHVAITPGIDFGSHQAHLHVRFAYTQRIEKLQQALERIHKFIELY